MSDLKEKIIEQKKRMKEFKSKLHEDCKVFFGEEIKVIFEKYPKLEQFSWTQYTPYFNDGDTCEFGVNNCYLTINGIGPYIDDSAEELEYAKIEEKQRCKIDTELTQFLELFDEDTMLAMFGDHCEVSVTKNKEGKIDVEVNEYEHE